MTATAGRQSSHPYINSRLKLRLKLIATTGYRFDNTIISRSFTNLNLPAGNITNKDINQVYSICSRLSASCSIP